jgi:hypothetical protein
MPELVGAADSPQAIIAVRTVSAALPALAKPFNAIAAMSENRVIGRGKRIPWHLPEDSNGFKKMTAWQAAVMGRKTVQSIGKPPPGQTTIVLRRAGSFELSEEILDGPDFKILRHRNVSPAT